jgi:four helix bundle protein
VPTISFGRVFATLPFVKGRESAARKEVAMIDRTLALFEALPSDAPMLDAERLDVYRVALEFQALAAGLVLRRCPALRDQLERASVSIALNVAEAAGRLSVPDKARFFAIARGSATESAAILDLLRARGLVSGLDYRRGRSLLVRVIQMLTRLSRRER